MTDRERRDLRGPVKTAVWTRKKTSTFHHPNSRWESIETRSITYHVESH